MASVFKIKRRTGFRYGVSYYLPDGTRVKKIIGPKWHQADDYRQKLENESREGRWEIVTAKEILFSEFAKEYLLSKKAKSTAKTYTTYFFSATILMPVLNGPIFRFRKGF